MAWTDQCRYSARQTIDKTIADSGLSAKKAIREVSKESGIPASTLDRWYWPGDKTSTKNGATKTKSQKAHWRAVERKLSSLVDYMKENCQCNSGNVTRELSVKIIDRIGYLKTVEGHYLEGEKNGKGK